MLNINEHLHHYLVKWKISWLFNYVLCLAAQSFMTLCDPMEPRQAPVSTGILQARTLEWVAMTSSRGSFQPRDWTQVSHIAGRFFTVWETREALLNYTPK